MRPITLRLAACAALATLAPLATLGALAADGGWYIGAGAAADSQTVTYGKTVYTEESLAQGESTSADAEADGAVFTLSALGGYRWQLPAESDLHLSLELDAAWHPNKLEGKLEGTGYTWTDTWPEDWWLKRKSSMGLTVKIGAPLPRTGFDLYALVGLRRVATEFSITETGCPGPELQCPPTPLASFTDTVDRNFRAWTLGAGVERQLGERFALQLEVRRTRYSRKRWDRLFEGGVIIPSSVAGRELGLALRLVRYFQ